jgi:pyruvate/2-oxoglutarate dehydrogenase complex dihydrolipoamide dehydrogenase (E3) component
MSLKDANYDIIVIGAGSGGLSVSLFMHKAGFKVLLIDRSDQQIGGDCLNDGCVPSKALIHISRIVHEARKAGQFGMSIEGSLDARRVMEYVVNSQNIIREHENATYFRNDGLAVALGEASLTGVNEVKVNERLYRAKAIVIATGSRPVKLKIPGIELVKYYDNESIFHIDHLPKKLLVIGGGPIGVEIGQAFQRLGSSVVIVHRGKHILKKDPVKITNVLKRQMEKEGVTILLQSEVKRFVSSTLAEIEIDGKITEMSFDAIFVAIGRKSDVGPLTLQNGNIKVNDGQIVVDEFLRTTNKNIYVCGDVAGSLKFSHAAEHQARIILNNLFSPLKKKLNNDYLSWVTFTDPEVASFGLNEQEIRKRKISYELLETGFEDDDRAVVDSHRYSQLTLYVSKKNLLFKQRILGGSMVAPRAGELVQELILANTNRLSINTLFNKIYPYPVAARINQKIIVDYKAKGLTNGIKKLLRMAFNIFN